MADISISRDHALEPAELRKRLDRMAEDMNRKFGIKSRWDGDTCHLTGAGLKSGKVVMTPTRVSLEITLGMMARLLKGQIEKEIEVKVADLLRA
ncbi:MAG: polyhydroxyalkanoic acid system family protein [Deltaproteobacteria bacterium]|nr:polyhydroxyalkanoic acid system family protein [Deltaproteobacteria bacterium]